MTNIFIISAPSGSGKTTLANLLRERVADLLFAVSYTTRERRVNESNGREYFFVPRDEFEKMVAAGDFLEHAEVYGKHYGTPRRFLAEAEAKGQDLLLDIDVQGEEQIKRKLPTAVSVFILPPSRAELEKRLRKRGDAYSEKIDSEETIQRRLRTAAREIEKYPNYDYILVNDQLEPSFTHLRAIVEYERAKRAGRAVDPNVRAEADACRNERMKEQARSVLASFQLSATASGD
jgi:guanylate kinase